MKECRYLTVLRALPGAARRILEELVSTGTTEYKFKSDFALRNQAIGKAEGKAEGKADSVLEVLAVRGLRVPDESRERILSCKDLKQLQRWLDRAVTAGSADELFD